MKKINNINAYFFTYNSHGIDWTIVILEKYKEDKREFYLCDGEIYEYAFGSAINQKYMNPPHIETLEDFLEIVEGNLEHEIEYFLREHPYVMTY